MQHPLRLALPFAALLAATPLVAQPAFDGLGMGLGNLSRLSRAKTRSISPENFTGEKGKGGMATEGTGAAGRARSRPGLEGLARRVRIKAGDHVHAGRDQGPGRHPAHLDDADRPLALLDPAHLLGRRDRALGRVPGRRLLRLRLGRATPRSPRCRSASTPAARSTATGRCRSASRPGITMENIADGRR